MTRMNDLKANSVTFKRYSINSSPAEHSTILTAPAPVRHHYVKRSSQLSPQVVPPQPRSLISSDSASSCCTTSSTITSINSLSSSSHFSHPEPIHYPPAPLDASAIFHPYSPPTASHLVPAQLMSSRPLSHKPIVPSQTNDLSHLPIQPMMNKLNFDQLVQNLPPSYTLNLPSPLIHLDQAMKSEVVDRLGRSVKFENLIDLDFKTVVIFIRHFRCGYSQRYVRRLSQIANGENQDNEKKLHKGVEQEKMKMKRSNSNLDPKCKQMDELENWISANGVKVIVVGHGNYQLIESYKRILNCPFPVYTDLSEDQKVYKLLGMKKVTDLKHQSSSNQIHQLSFDTGTLKKSQSLGHVNSHSSRLNEPLIRKGESKLAFLSQVIYNAWRMPWKWSGDPHQLGGEMIFEPIREEKLIKRKPIKHKFVHDTTTKTNSIRSNSSSGTTTTTAEESLTSNALTTFRRPSCSIKNVTRTIHNSSLRRNFGLFKDSTKEIQIQCKFIHQMTSFKDHFSIDELMMQSGIRLTSLMQKY